MNRLEALLRSPSSDPLVLAAALGLAFFLGAAHALTPGHGKAVVAAYLAGSRGRVKDAVFLGSVVTMAHTATVFALGLTALYASQHVALDRVYPWLALASGLMVAAIGGWLLWKRTRAHSHDGHHHHHDHPHPDRGSLISLGISGGLVPCPEALVVLLLSISLRRLAFGLAILAAFSLGLAAVLIALGSAMVLAAPGLRRFDGRGWWTRALPLVSAGIVTALGLAIAAQALGRI